MIPVYLGYDSRETVAWHVLAHSIQKHASEPCAFIPIGNETLPGRVWWRPRGAHDSTEFSNARFMIPALAGYEGWAIFMDCDMVCLGDIAELWAQRDNRYSVQVVKHRHEPTELRKFLGAEQARYNRKNWSSLMLVNCGNPSCRGLTPDYVNQAPGLDLHGFKWTFDSLIGEINGLWNVLAAPNLEHPEPVDRYAMKLIHYTLGGPWHGYEPEGSGYWWSAFEDMLAGRNPCAALTNFDDGPGVYKSVLQFKQRFSHEPTP